MITHDTNFCRVFELPEKYPSSFCFGGGYPVEFKMVDWFQPIPPAMLVGFSWDEWKPKLIEYIKQKNYFKHDRKYLVICDFDEALIIHV